MTKGTNQKLKMLYLKQIFEEETDDQHSLTLQNITERLNSLGVNADRKTLVSGLQGTQTLQHGHHRHAGRPHVELSFGKP